MNKIYSVPKQLNVSGALQFLRMAEYFFYIRHKRIPDVRLDLDMVNEIDVFGQLLIYKYVEFTTKNECFYSPYIITNPFVDGKLKESGFQNLLNAFINSKDIDYRKLDYQENGDSFFFAPIVLARDRNVNEKDKMTPKIENFFRDSPKVVSMAMTVIGEVSLNFKEHAVEDTQSVMVVSGNKRKIEISCADTGVGIVSSLANWYPDIKRKEKLIEKAIEKGVTSKKATNHIGFGLWIVNQLATLTKGLFYVFSEGAYYFNRHGKIKSGPCSFWKGTIVYVNLPLSHPYTLKDIPGMDFDRSLKINFN